MALKQRLFNKRSVIENKKPDASILGYGEIAINYNEDSPSIYIKTSGDSGESIVSFKPSSDSLYVTNSSSNTEYSATESNEVYINLKNNEASKISSGIRLKNEDSTITLSGENSQDINISVGSLYSDGIKMSEAETVGSTTVWNSGTTLTNALESVATVIYKDEKVVSNSLNDLNSRVGTIETDYAKISDIPTNVSSLANDAGYISGYTETDPIFVASEAYKITSADTDNWDNKISFIAVNGETIVPVDNAVNIDLNSDSVKLSKSLEISGYTVYQSGVTLTDALESLGQEIADDEYVYSDALLNIEKRKLDTITSSDGYLTVADKVETVDGTKHIISQAISLNIGTSDGTIAEGSHTHSQYALETDLERVESIAKGATQAIVFEDYEEMVTELNDSGDPAYNIGQAFYLREKEVPDLFVSGIYDECTTYTYSGDTEIISATLATGGLRVGYYALSQLETAKVDLVDYAKTSEIGTGTIKISQNDEEITSFGVNDASDTDINIENSTDTTLLSKDITLDDGDVWNSGMTLTNVLEDVVNVIEEDEKVVAGSLNDLNSRINTIETSYAKTSDIPTNVSSLTNDAGYISGYTETDPIFIASEAHNITSADTNNWNNKISGVVVNGNNLTANANTIYLSATTVTSGGSMLEAVEISDVTSKLQEKLSYYKENTKVLTYDLNGAITADDDSSTRGIGLISSSTTIGAMVLDKTNSNANALTVGGEGMHVLAGTYDDTKATLSVKSDGNVAITATAATYNGEEIATVNDIPENYDSDHVLLNSAISVSGVTASVSGETLTNTVKNLANNIANRLPYYKGTFNADTCSGSGIYEYITIGRSGLDTTTDDNYSLLVMNDNGVVRQIAYGRKKLTNVYTRLGTAGTIGSFKFEKLIKDWNTINLNSTDDVTEKVNLMMSGLTDSDIVYVITDSDGIYDPGLETNVTVTTDIQKILMRINGNNDAIAAFMSNWQAYYKYLTSWYSQSISSTLASRKVKSGDKVRLCYKSMTILEYCEHLIDFDSISIDDTTFKLYKSVKGYGSSTDGDFIRGLINNGDIYSAYSEPNNGGTTYQLKGTTVISAVTFEIIPEFKTVTASTNSNDDTTTYGAYTNVSLGRTNWFDTSADGSVLSMVTDDEKAQIALDASGRLYSRRGTGTWHSTNQIKTYTGGGTPDLNTIYEPSVIGWSLCTNGPVDDHHMTVYTMTSSDTDGNGYRSCLQIAIDRDTSVPYFRTLFKNSSGILHTDWQGGYLKKLNNYYETSNYAIITDIEYQGDESKSSSVTSAVGVLNDTINLGVLNSGAYTAQVEIVQNRITNTSNIYASATTIELETTLAKYNGNEIATIDDIKITGITVNGETVAPNNKVAEIALNSNSLKITEDLEISGYTVSESGSTVTESLNDIVRELFYNETVASKALIALSDKVDAVSGSCSNINVKLDYYSEDEETAQINTSNINLNANYVTLSATSSANINTKGGQIKIDTSDNEASGYKGSVIVTSRITEIYGNHLRYNGKRLAIKDNLQHTYNNIVVGKCIPVNAMPYKWYYFQDGIVKIKVKTSEEFSTTINVNNTDLSAIILDNQTFPTFTGSVYTITDGTTKYNSKGMLVRVEKNEGGKLYLETKKISKGIHETSTPGVIIDKHKLHVVREVTPSVNSNEIFTKHNLYAFTRLCSRSGIKVAFNGKVFSKFAYKYKNKYTKKRVEKFPRGKQFTHRFMTKVLVARMVKKRWKGKFITLYAFGKL